MGIRNDTIVAIATPLGEGAIGVVRLSGAESAAIARRIFSGRLSDHRLTYGAVVDPESNDQVDEAMAVLMKAPRTYTREDVVEIHGHGGLASLRGILALCLRYGARQAEPGEFTLRAFLNGRLDLTQAEAVLDIIQAKTDASLRLAMSGLKGRLSDELRSVRTDLIEVLAHLVARIDFPDDDVPPVDVQPRLRAVESALHRLVAAADAGMIYRQGVRIAIVGQPNVGKSSLLNRLLGEDRAIVTDIPGTTRDTLEETISLRGVPVVLTDTAGLNSATADAVELLGIERSRTAIGRSDAILVVLDGSRPVGDEERRLLGELPQGTTLVAVNKSDLPARAVLAGCNLPIVRVAARTGQGLAELQDAMFRLITSGKVFQDDSAIITNTRQKEALVRAARCTSEAIASCVSGATEDLIAIDVTAAIDALGEITGETVTEDLLDTIFSRFCIGK
jgi:tRNA modification GTPase